MHDHYRRAAKALLVLATLAGISACSAEGEPTAGPSASQSEIGVATPSATGSPSPSISATPSASGTSGPGSGGTGGGGTSDGSGTSGGGTSGGGPAPSGPPTSPGASSVAEACATMQSAAWVLTNAIVAAEVVVNDASSTPQQVTTAVQALEPAVYGFRDQLYAASSQTTDTGLKAAIAQFASEIPSVAAAAATGDFNAFINAMSATSGDDQIGALCGF